jgi:lysophospholipase L1-like esterase
MKTFALLTSLLCLPLAALAADSAAGKSPANSNVQSNKSLRSFYTPAQDKGGLTGGDKIDATLPNVLILGDSISIGYTAQVREGLKGRANVLRPKANCGDTPMGLAGIDKWLGTNHWDVIHFNWGLWDLCYRHPESKEQGHRDKVHGQLSTSPEDYEKNLEALVLRLKRTGATLIWASTTVVPEGEVGRFVGDEIKYNAIAARVMKKHGIMTDDLYATTKAFPPAMFSKPGDVHFTEQGYAKLARQVVEKIGGVLKK